MFDEFERYTLENLCEKSIEYDPDLGKQIEEQLGLNQSNISRRNPWGNLSYAQLIDKAIKHSSQQKLTLSQIYSWISLYVPYFNKKNDKNTSQQWKVCLLTFIVYSSNQISLFFFLLKKKRIPFDIICRYIIVS